MKRSFLFLVLLAAMVLTASPLSGVQNYVPGKVYVRFQPGAVNSLYQDSTGHTCCGIAYIDSVNRANGGRICVDL